MVGVIKSFCQFAQSTTTREVYNAYLLSCNFFCVFIALEC